MKKLTVLSAGLAILFGPCWAQQSPQLRQVAERAIAKSHTLKMKQAETDKARIDKQRAYNAYLPKIQAEATYTHLNDPLTFPSDMQTLLMGAKELYFKEQMSMAGAPVSFNTKMSDIQAYANSLPDFLPNGSANTVKQTLLGGYKVATDPIPNIQDQNFFKANISAQWVFFTGLKAPMLIKAATHQISAYELLTETEKSKIIFETATTWDKLAVVYQSEDVLNSTELLIDEQWKFVEKAIQNGMATDLQRQKVILARQQLASKRIELNANKQLLISKLYQLSGVSMDSLAAARPELQVWVLTSHNADASQRADLKAIDEAIKATSYKRKSEMSEYIPKAFAFGKRELYENSLTMLDPKWYVGVGIRWTIFDGSASYNASRQAKIEQIVLEEKKAEATDLYNLNLQRIGLDIDKNTQLVETARQQLLTTEKMHELSLKQFQQGMISLTEYQQSVNELESARLEMLKAIYAQRTSVIEYLDASGNLSLNNL
jgi:outer membrane protein TolC